MITEDYVSFETAKLLKEKGFPQQKMEFAVAIRDCSFIVNGSQRVKECAGTKFPYYPYSKLFLYEEDWAVLPTLQMAMKWLLKKYNIFICILFLEESNGFGYTIENIVKKEYITTSKNSSYKEIEDACEEAIKYCLEHLI